MLLATACLPGRTEAQANDRRQIDIPAATLGRAIEELSRETGVSIGTPGSLPALRTPAIRGNMRIGEALRRLLAGSGYVARAVSGNAWRIERRAADRPVMPPARRPEPARPPETVGETIVVTATKRDAALFDVPMAVSVLAVSPVEGVDPSRDSGTVAARIEGLALTGLGPGRNRMFLRGIADSAFNGESQSTVAVLLDGSRLTYTAPDPDLRLVDVERVEVIKGPQGSLYGTGALGGIYQIVTRRPDLGQTDAFVSAGVTTVQGGGTGFNSSAMFNLPLLRDRAGLRLVGYRIEEPGWIDTGSRRDSNLTRVTGGRAALGIAIAPGWRIDLSGLAQLIDVDDSQYVYAPGARRRPAQLAEPHDNDLVHFAARLVHRGAIDVELISGATWHEVGNSFDATIGAAGFGLAYPERLNDDREYRVIDQELRLSGKRGRIRWLAGLSYVDASQLLTLDLQSATGAGLQIDRHRRTTRDLALFGDLGIPLTDRLTLDLGGRVFNTKVADSRLGPVRTEEEREGRSGFTPSMALSWSPGGNRLAYLRYGSAFRQGGTDFSRTGAPARTLKGDELATIEAGWRQQSGRVRLEAGTWYTMWENIQSDVLGADGLVVTRNIGRGRSLGAEASVTIDPAPGWTAEAGLTFVQARLTRNDLGLALVDRRLPVVPDYVVRLGVERHFGLPRGEAVLGLRARYVGPSALSFDPAINRPMGHLVEGQAEARVHWGRLDVTARIDNLFGEDEDMFAFGNALRFSTLRQFTPMAPRQITLAVSARF